MSRTPWYKWRRDRWCPELALFPTDDARRTALRQAARLREMLPLLLLFLIVAEVITELLGPLLASLAFTGLSHAIQTAPALAHTLLTTLLYLAMGATALHFWWQPRFRKSIRRQLVQAGIAVCMKCGYDLRGQTQPRCPECGTPFDVSPLDRAGNDPNTK